MTPFAIYFVYVRSQRTKYFPRNWLFDLLSNGDKKFLNFIIMKMNSYNDVNQVPPLPALNVFSVLTCFCYSVWTCN